MVDEIHNSNGISVNVLMENEVDFSIEQIKKDWVEKIRKSGMSAEEYIKKNKEIYNDIGVRSL